MPDPARAEGEVRIRVHVAGVNFADVAARLGVYPGVPKPPVIPGLEVAGVVEAAPPGAAIGEGDRVAAVVPFGGYAQRVSVPSVRVFPIPDAMPFEDAAALAINYLTAYHAMFALGNLTAGDRILVHSAAGGVGVAVAQLAKVRGIKVFGTAGPSKQEFLRSLGIDRPIDYTKEDFEEVVRREAPEGIEMAMDPVGGKSIAKSERCLGPAGRLVVYGVSAPFTEKGRVSLTKGAAAILGSPRFRALELFRDNRIVIGLHLGRLGDRLRLLQPEFEALAMLYLEGKVKPVIGAALPLEKAEDAHWMLHRRESHGKIVLRVP